MKLGRRLRSVLILVIGAALASTSCQAIETAPGTSPGIEVLSTPGPIDALPTDLGEEDQATEPAPGIAILEDEAFRGESARICAEARPARVYDLDGPSIPAVKVPGYGWLHIVVLEMRDGDGTVGPPPSLPPGEAYYPTAFVSIEGSTEVLPGEAAFASQVDLLACVVLRAGQSRVYSGERGDVTVIAMDAVVWMVDCARGARVGDPWVAKAELSTLINTGNLLSVGGARVLPADIRTGIAYFMGLAVPLSGAYQGGADGWVVAEYDAPADLPPGTRLLPGYTFVVRLVMFQEQSSVIDFIDLLCAPRGTVSGPPLRVAMDVPHDIGRFVASSADVEIEGDFMSNTLVTGQIHGLSQRARDCGVPRSTPWQAALALSARPDDTGYVLFLP